MKEFYGDLFDLVNSYDAICVTTNGIVKTSGAAVMGAGVAKTCAQLWPQTPTILGELLTSSGRNVPFHLGNVTEGDFWTQTSLETENTLHFCRIFSFPTKHHYSNPSDIDLIKESCHHMVAFADQLQMQLIALSRPGCGNGGLVWADVSPIISKILDERFYIIERKGN